ncbi:28S ribosomal protein S9, mitochondrial isoform X2 [Apis florea]|uniref:28S ribosomal protein S9, mitochondrial isoform X2 n=1 Tax=Apis florea TaxID=7463 RepID=UPI0006297A89|nr:28S ribosomal protein S9, mitochondrial isoform X2 [Apis florea]
MAIIFTRFVNIRNATNNNNFGSFKSILNIVPCSGVIFKSYCINVNDNKFFHNSMKMPKKKINKAMKAYLERSREYKQFIERQTLEYNIGKRNLAKMMGEDPNNFTQKNIKNAICYLFPSGLYDKEARPMMADPEELYAHQKEAEFNEDGRPYHFLHYTIKANYYEILHKIVELINYLNKIEDQLLITNQQITEEKKINLNGSEWLEKTELENMLLEKLSDSEYEYFIKSMQSLANHPVSKHEESFIMKYRKMLTKINDNIQLPKPQYDSDNRPFVLIEKCQRKTSIGQVKVIGNGSGNITINGQDIAYFSDIQCREQINDVIE